jgi:Sulfotransferase domain
MADPVRIPDSFIVGAPKSGTTALYEYLRQHPDIFMSPLKEPRFFSTDVHFTHRAPLSLAEYLACFAGARAERRIGEASNTYLYSRVAAKAIKAFSPEARIIVMLRHPVDMMHARHSQNLWTGAEVITDFAAALDAEEERRRRGGSSSESSTIDEHLFYRDAVRYTEQVERYVETFGRDRVHVIIYDEFRRDTRKAYVETLTFLGVRADFRPNLGVVNANKRARNPMLDAMLQRPPSVVRWLARTMLDRPRRKRFKAALRLLNARVEARPPMEAALRRQLQAEFRPEIERLSALLRKDLSFWNATEP